MIEIKCSKRQYERIIDALRTYFEDGHCALGKTYFSCFARNNDDLTCKQCIRKRIKRMDGKEQGDG